MLDYLLERFLYRVSVHPLGRQHFVLKGGLLLAQFGARRVTRDIDILGRAFPGDEQEITRRISEIAATAVDDGVTFEPGTLTTVPIRQDAEYPQYLTGGTLTLYGYPIATGIEPGRLHSRLPASPAAARTRYPSRHDALGGARLREPGVRCRR